MDQIICRDADSIVMMHKAQCDVFEYNTKSKTEMAKESIRRLTFDRVPSTRSLGRWDARPAKHRWCFARDPWELFWRRMSCCLDS